MTKLLSWLSNFAQNGLNKMDKNSVVSWPNHTDWHSVESICWSSLERSTIESWHGFLFRTIASEDVLNWSVQDFRLNPSLISSTISASEQAVIEYRNVGYTCFKRIQNERRLDSMIFFCESKNPEISQACTPIQRKFFKSLNSNVRSILWLKANYAHLKLQKYVVFCAEFNPVSRRKNVFLL